jgi:site-specific recombinase XerD
MAALEHRGRELAELHKKAREFIAAAKAAATRSAYRGDWEHFAAWCRERELSFLPATPETVALYLTALAATHKPATLSRRLTSINKAHQAAGLEAPGRMEKAAVGETLKGIRRTVGVAQAGKKPLLTADMQKLIAGLPGGLLGVRDRALLLMGFAGGFRRAELAALAVADIAETDDGLMVNLRFSKTDQEGQGRKVALPYGSSEGTCPVRAYRSWIERAGITAGPVFRGVDRHGNLGGEGLHKDSVGMIVKRAAKAAGLDPKPYAGHSLRAGLATQAYLNGANELAIMRQTGHRSLEMVRRYIRDIELFKDNPASKLGL